MKLLVKNTRKIMNRRSHEVVRSQNPQTKSGRKTKIISMSMSCQNNMQTYKIPVIKRILWTETGNLQLIRNDHIEIAHNHASTKQKERTIKRVKLKSESCKQE